MKIFYLLLSVMCLSARLYAQTGYLVKGAVTDTASNTNLQNASVSVLQAKDSMLVSFTRTKLDGAFNLTLPKKGSYILMITYPKYADYVERFTLDSAHQSRDFGKLNLFLKSRLLQEVIIKGQVSAIKIKGDTTEFNAGNFKVQPNAKVEDLLKQLPGIQVDQNGKITAQGQAVSKVLVDGEEFFGDDPTLVTKNIRADMVDKVQLYDKKSDQATFTGIDDGEKTKTINIKLKEDKKNGMFGKVDAGAGTDGYYQGQAMINAFKGKKKLAAYGTAANNGKVSLGWEDNNKYGTSGDDMQFEDGMIFINGNNDEFSSWNGNYNGEGIPVARNGGAHFENKWKNDKQSLNANYKIGSLDVSGNRNSLINNTLPSGVNTTSSDENFDNYLFRQKLDFTYQVKLDTTSNLKISVDGTLRNSRSSSAYQSSVQRGFDTLLNHNARSLTSEGDQRNMNMTAFWNKKFKKAGRTISLNLKESLNDDNSDGFLNSEIDFYDELGQQDSVSNINQQKTNTSKSSLFNSNLTYTEPLSKTFSTILNYGLNYNHAISDLRSYNQTLPGIYNELDSLYSNKFTFDQFSHAGGLNFNYKKGKTTLNFGTKAQTLNFKQLNGYTSRVYERNFFNWMPQAMFQYRFSQQRSFRFNYNGSTEQPTINQLQPVLVNDDPLNIVIGNPALKPAFRNRFNINYNSYKVLTNQNIYVYGSVSLVSNPIVSNNVTDQTGKTVYQSSNLSGKTPVNYYGGFGYYSKIKKPELNYGISFNTDGNTYYNLTNNVVNRTVSNNYSGNIQLSKYKQKKYEFSVNFRPGYSFGESSLQQQVNNNGWTFNSDASFNIYLPGKLQIGSDANYEFRQKTQSFNENFDRMIWNAWISRKFLKQDNLAVTVKGNDLLNQNVGFNRYAFNNQISQTNYTTIRRYFMFSVTWDFNKMGGASAK
ncbi:outer membrane beta-barrel protein [Pedobacter sp. HMF7647]|uniref:Outer membrane beta-barrel protein n=1 Tax=Hufsiella arboris TaxID=2695275 RepID=A0A7K1YES6_9SPHI|nr:TonB-dependent receptor family protein [Hufsiella arboris]MXV52891.1 outer membrane beta-barrel protein [Hufsiella arboris]